MIGKRVRRSRRAERGSIPQMACAIETLTTYILNAQLAPPQGAVVNLTRHLLEVQDAADSIGEKVAAFGAWNLAGTAHQGWAVQLTAVASQCVRARDPLEHFILSWREDEKPTTSQFEQAAKVALDTMGYEHCPAVWAAHTNTKHHHIHIGIVRFDLRAGRMANDRWDIDSLHKAVARIELEQGWRAEANSLYTARYDRDGRIAYRPSHDRIQRDNWRRGESGLLQGEQLQAREAAARSLARSTTWAEFHSLLRLEGMGYRRVGAGARISKGERSWKASSFDRSLALPSMEAGMGRFRPGEDPDCEAFPRYRASCNASLKRLKTLYDRIRERLEKALHEELAKLAQVQDALRHALRACMEAEYRAATKVLKDVFKRAKVRIEANRLAQKAWRLAGKPVQMPDADMPFALFCGKVNWLSPRPGTAVDGFSELKAEWSTRYIGTDNAEIADVTSVIFVDGGDVARVGALRLAADRWPTIEIIGTPQTEAQVSTLARELGIALRSDAVPRTGSSEQHFPNPGQSDYLLVQSRGHQSFAPRFGDSQSEPMRAAPDLKTPNKQATVDLFGSINAPDLPMAPLPTVSATAAAEPSTDPDELYFAQLLALHAAKKGRGR